MYITQEKNSDPVIHNTNLPYEGSWIFVCPECGEELCRWSTPGKHRWVVWNIHPADRFLFEPCGGWVLFQNVPAPLRITLLNHFFEEALLGE